MDFFMEIFRLDVLAVIVTILALAIGYIKWKFSYWTRTGLEILNPTFPFGDSKDLALGNKTFFDQFMDIYKQFKAKGTKHGGIYMGLQPWYVPIDPDIVKHIMQVDFQNFVNRGVYLNEEVDPLSAHLFSLDGAKWRNMRIKLTPTFTSGKMKMMFQTMADCTVGLKAIMDRAAKDREPVDIKEILSRFTTDIIGSTAFGLECNSLEDPQSLFLKFGKRIFVDTTTWERWHGMLQFFLPHRLLKALNYKVSKNDVASFFTDVVRDTVAYREKNNIYRKDFMHLLLQLKNRGTITDDEKITEDNKTEKGALTINELTAQVVLFFAAGFETSSTTMTFALYELATNQDIQDKLRGEIKTVLAQHDNQMTYDSIMEMTYMEKVLNETLRKYPPVSVLLRQCTKSCTIPRSTVEIKEGIKVAIPVAGLHYDPEYYPEPERFDPERFSVENKNSRHHFTWLPFGEGPRNCIGLRFGLLQSKVGIAALLKNFRVKPSTKTKVPLTLDKASFITTVEGGVWLDVERLD